MSFSEYYEGDEPMEWKIDEIYDDLPENIRFMMQVYEQKYGGYHLKFYVKKPNDKYRFYNDTEVFYMKQIESRFEEYKQDAIERFTY